MKHCNVMLVAYCSQHKSSCFARALPVTLALRSLCFLVRIFKRKNSRNLSCLLLCWDLIFQTIGWLSFIWKFNQWKYELYKESLLYHTIASCRWHSRICLCSASTFCGLSYPTWIPFTLKVMVQSLNDWLNYEILKVEIELAWWH